MLAAQIPLPLARSYRPRVRSNRRPFTPAPQPGPYRLPHDVRDRLASALAPFRNRDAAFTLAVFLARFWSAPGRIENPFAIDRRALAECAALDLTEARVRGAIRVLEHIGFLDRIEGRGSRYRPTEEGLHRKPMLFRFGPEYRAGFEIANKRAAAARSRRSGDRRAIPPSQVSRPSQASLFRPLNSPKSSSVAVPQVYLGELRKGGIPPKAFEPNPELEAALDRLRHGVIGKAEADDGRTKLDS